MNNTLLIIGIIVAYWIMKTKSKVTLSSSTQTTYGTLKSGLYTTSDSSVSATANTTKTPDQTPASTSNNSSGSTTGTISPGHAAQIAAGIAFSSKISKHKSAFL